MFFLKKSHSCNEMKGDKLHSMNIFRLVTDFSDNLRSEILEYLSYKE